MSKNDEDHVGFLENKEKNRIPRNKTNFHFNYLINPKLD